MLLLLLMGTRNSLRPCVLVAAFVLASAVPAAAGAAIELDGEPLRYARASLYQAPYGNVTLDIELSAQRLRCDDDPGAGLRFSVHPGPKNRFFAGTTPVEIDLYRYGNEQDSVEIEGATVVLARFELKNNSKLGGRITVPGHGTGSFSTTLCPVRKVTLPIALPDTVGELAVTFDKAPWKPKKVLATQALVDGKPAIQQIWFVDAQQTCEQPTGAGSLSLTAAAAARNPGTVQATQASLQPLVGAASYSGLTSLAWLQLEPGKKELRGRFAARADADEGPRWDASGTFTAQLCPVR